MSKPKHCKEHVFGRLVAGNPTNLLVCGPRQPPTVQETLQIPRFLSILQNAGFGTIPGGGVVANREPGSYIDLYNIYVEVQSQRKQKNLSIEWLLQQKQLYQWHGHLHSKKKHQTTPKKKTKKTTFFFPFLVLTKSIRKKTVPPKQNSGSNPGANPLAIPAFFGTQNGRGRHRSGGEAEWVVKTSQKIRKSQSKKARKDGRLKLLKLTNFFTIKSIIY